MRDTNIKILPQDILWNANRLGEVHLPRYLTRIEFRALYGIGIEVLDIPATVTEAGSIGYLASNGCPQLQEVNIRTIQPDSRLMDSNMGYQIFTQCPNLNSINVGWISSRTVNGITKDGQPWNWGAPNATINYNYKFNA